jgi:hypothetical protein
MLVLAAPRQAALLLCVICCASFWGPGHAGLVTTVEYLSEPLGLETRVPRFSWHLDSTAAAALPRGSVQTTFRIRVATSPSALNSTGATNGGSAGICRMVWDSGTALRNASTLVEYAGATPLAFDGIYWWRVGVTYAPASSSSVATGEMVWSTPTRFSIGPDGAAMAAAASSASAAARFIGAHGVDSSACPWLRSPRFRLPAAAAGLTALATVGSVGYHELWVNGRKATPDVLSPPVSDLAKRVLLRTYDVTALLKRGGGEENVMGLWLARGWANLDSVNPRVSNLFNSSAGSAIAIARLALTTTTDDAVAAGTDAATATVVLGTGGAWKASASDTVHRGLWKNSDFGGDRVDARLSQPLWSSPNFDDSGWAAARVVAAAPEGRVLSNDVSEPNRLRETIPARSVTAVRLGVRTGWLVEMEQVFAGWVVLTGLRAKPGATVSIKASSVPVCGTPAAAAAGVPTAPTRRSTTCSTRWWSAQAARWSTFPRDSPITRCISSCLRG